MTGFNHGVAGAVIAITIKQPLLAVPIAFLSHFVIDMIPHFGLDEKEVFGRRFNIILLADFLFSVSLMAFFWLLFIPPQIWLIWACMVAAASPDLMWAYHRLYVERLNKREPKLGYVARLHHKIQWSQTLRGLYVEAAWFLLIFSFILMRYYFITTSPR
jgi:hypothetical protein